MSDLGPSDVALSNNGSSSFEQDLDSPFYPETKELLLAPHRLRNVQNKSLRSSQLTPKEHERILHSVAQEFARRGKLNQLSQKIKNAKILARATRETIRAKKLRSAAVADEREDPHEEDDAKSTLTDTRDSFQHAIRYEKTFQSQDCTHVRLPKLAQLLSCRRFILYNHRFANAQIHRTLSFPTLPQPDSPPLPSSTTTKKSEQQKTRPLHRFVVCADTQFGIIMDGMPMSNPNWQREIALSRKAVSTINQMSHPRPLFVCVCGDLVDTESSFCSAMASWKMVMKDWERSLLFEQQNRDFKEVWSHLDEDIALICLCGNHDVGNRPTRASIERFKSTFGDDYLAFWVNGSYNIMMNNCLFSNPTGAMDMWKEQITWVEERLTYAQENRAGQIFVFGHFPWFLYHDTEDDADIPSASYPPKGWGSPGAKFSDFYFNIPRRYREVAMSLFRRYNVTACFSGHFHQNLIAKSSWGMDMIITGPLSMILKSDNNEHKSSEPQECGMRIVTVNAESDSFHHTFVPLNDE